MTPATLTTWLTDLAAEVQAGTAAVLAYEISAGVTAQVASIEAELRRWAGRCWRTCR